MKKAPCSSPIVICLMLTALYLCPADALANHPVCDSRYVEVAATKITVAPSAPNQRDAENLQCALRTAVHEGQPTVELLEGEYDLRSRIAVNDFAGTLKGHTITTTNVVGCSGKQGAIVFMGGSPTITRMTFDSRGKNCDERIVVTTVDESCGVSTTIFAKLDRLRFLNDRYGDQSAIVVSPPEACFGYSMPDTKLLGKLLINRVEMIGEYEKGAKISMAGGAQVDIFFSDIVGREVGVDFVSSGANAQIVGTTIETSLLGSLALQIDEYPGVRRTGNVLNVSNSTILGYDDAIYQNCSATCYVNISNSEVRARFGSAIESGRKGAFRIFDSDIRSDKSILLYDNSVMTNNDLNVSAIPDIRLLGSGNTINQPDNDVIAPIGSNNLVSSRK